MNTSHLFLIGYRCSGKSSVGKRLSEQYSIQHVDTDDLIEQQEDQTIPEIWAQKGASYFRAVESNVLHRICNTGESMIVSTGGGIITSPENRDRLSSQGHVIWLTASPPTLRNRLQSDAVERPSLTENPVEDEIKQVLEERTPHYRSVADWEITTENRSVKEVVDAIIKKLQHTKKLFPSPPQPSRD